MVKISELDDLGHAYELAELAGLSGKTHPREYSAFVARVAEILTAVRQKAIGELAMEQQWQ